MAREKVELDVKGLEEAATSAAVQRAVDALAEKVATIVRGQYHMVEGVPGDVPLPVTTHSGETTDMRLNRARASVTLAHPSGKAVQAKHGALTKAAAQAGLRVKG